MKDELTIIKEYLNYEPETGDFFWIKKPNRKIPVGSKAGCKSRGRLQIRVNGKMYRAHRLAWFYYYGSHPNFVIDHINGDPMDNRISNLRDVSHSVNLQNQRRPTSRNQLQKYLGVSSASNQKTGYRARINHTHLGTFKTPEEARDAYLEAKRRLHEGCAI